MVQLNTTYEGKLILMALNKVTIVETKQKQLN